MKITGTFCLCIACAVFFQGVSAQRSPTLKFREGKVWLTRIGSTSIPKGQWSENLLVFTADAFEKHLNQPVAGKYAWHGDSISFTPNFSFAPGGRYYAVAGELELPFFIPKENLNSTFVETIHPQAGVLPENMLRMYISFSAPMMQGEAFDHITLLNNKGEKVDKAFLVIDQELWDAEHKRFTLLFDPGRVKRGIQSNLDLGAPLQAGQAYQLIIDSAWRDANGNPLARRYIKKFTVSDAERTKLSMQKWKITAPTASTREDLLIEFDHPIDYVLTMKSITISAIKMGKVRGQATLQAGRYWHFTPEEPWLEGHYLIEVHPQLEDTAGNTFNNTFDIDLSKENRVNSSELIRKPFSIKAVAK